MARSTYIYLVTNDGRPVAAFTVKWEMKEWLSMQPIGDYEFFRMKDGLDYAHDGKRPVEMNDG